MANFIWNKAMRDRLRKVGRDRMNTEAWELVEDLLTRVEELEAEIAALRSAQQHDEQR